MPEQTKTVQLGLKDLEQMRHLTHDLSDLLEKIAHIVLPKIGQKDEGCKSFTVVLARSEPLTIGFGSSANTPSMIPPSDVVGYYIDPPGC
jgi:hypothetical protein